MRVLKSYGTEGGVIVSTADVPYDFELDEPVFITFDELPVPFFIEEWQDKGKTKAFVKFEDIDTLADADAIVGKEILLGDPENEEFATIEGFTVLDQAGAKAGTVIDFVDIPGNPCIEVQHGSERVLLPCHEDLIIDIDERRRTIRLQIAEGLL